MQRVLQLYDHPPADGRVICLDEFGPLNLMPRRGKRWRPARSPARLRATYNRYNGVMHMIAALDLASSRSGPGTPNHAAVLANGAKVLQYTHKEDPQPEQHAWG